MSTLLLLDTLSGELSSDTKELLSVPQWKEKALTVLEDMLNSNNFESLLDTKVLLPDNEVTQESRSGGNTYGITEQIAELTNESMLLDNKIVNTLTSNNNVQMILESNEIFAESFGELDTITSLTKSLRVDDTFASWMAEVITINTNLGTTANDNDARNDNNKKENSNTKSQASLTISKSSSSELSLILQNLDNLTEILELPTITHSLIRTSQYSECIEISALAKRLKIRYNNIELINSIEKNISFEIEDMVKKLAGMLVTNLKQSSMIKILTYLKRVVTDRDQLKTLFLHLRYKFIVDEFETLLPLKQSKLIEKYLKRVLEIFREFCFQTVITFDSVFEKDRQQTHEFLTATVGTLCDILVENLVEVEDAARESLLMQLLYCCQSLARVGGDFTATVAARLESASVLEPGKLLSAVRKQQTLVRSFA